MQENTVNDAMRVKTIRRMWTATMVLTLLIIAGEIYVASAFPWYRWPITYDIWTIAAVFSSLALAIACHEGGHAAAALWLGQSIDGFCLGFATGWRRVDLTGGRLTMVPGHPDAYLDTPTPEDPAEKLFLAAAGSAANLALACMAACLALWDRPTHSFFDVASRWHGSVAAFVFAGVLAVVNLLYPLGALWPIVLRDGADQPVMVSDGRHILDAIREICSARNA